MENKLAWDKADVGRQAQEMMVAIGQIIGSIFELKQWS